MVRRINFLSIVVLLGLGGGVEAQTAFVWKFKTGDVFFLDENVVANNTVTVAGMTMDQKTTTRRVSKYTVVKAGPDGFVLEQTMLTWRNKQEGGGGPPVPEDLLDRLTKGIVFKLHMTPTGSVTKLEGFEDFMDRARRELGPAEARAFGSIVNEDVFRSGADLMFNVLPPKAVRVGDRWTRRTRIPLGPLGNMQMSDNLTLKTLDKGRATLDVASTMAFSPPRDGDLGGLRITKIDLKSSGATGQVVFDLNAGRLASFDLSVPMGGSMTAEAGGMSITVDLRGAERRTARVSDKDPR